MIRPGSGLTYLCARCGSVSAPVVGRVEPKCSTAGCMGTMGVRGPYPCSPGQADARGVWAAPFGRLVVRMVVDIDRLDMDLGFADDAAAPAHGRTIAETRAGVTRGCLTPCVEHHIGLKAHLGSGATQIRRLASDADLAMMVALWRDGLDELAFRVRHIDALAEIDRGRLLRAIGR